MLYVAMLYCVKKKNSLFLSASLVAVRLVETVAITLKYAGLTVAKTSSRIPVKIKGGKKRLNLTVIIDRSAFLLTTDKFFDLLRL